MATSAEPRTAARGAPRARAAFAGQGTRGQQAHPLVLTNPKRAMRQFLGRGGAPGPSGHLLSRAGRLVPGPVA